MNIKFKIFFMIILIAKSKEILECEDIKLNKIRLLEKPMEIYYHLLRKIFCFNKKSISSENAEKIILDMKKKDDNMNYKKINNNSDLNQDEKNVIFFESSGSLIKKFYLPKGEFNKKIYMVEKNV